MPLTAKGKKIKRSMERFYGKKRGDRVFYASENAGRIQGVARGHAHFAMTDAELESGLRFLKGHSMRRRHGMRRRGHAARTPMWAKGASYLIDRRVQLKPYLDRWMMGDRYGTITGFTFENRVVKVKLDKSGKTLRYRLDDLELL
jgi:hypothetical protein